MAHGGVPPDIGKGTMKKIVCLFVDDSGVEYFSKDGLNHLLNSISYHYAVSTDWGGCKL